MLAAVIAALAAGCGERAGNNTVTLIFPSNENGKTEFNASIYEKDPFAVTLCLPDGWNVKEQNADGDYEMLSVFSKYDILNKNNMSVGAAGFQIYEPYEGAEEDPIAIYHQIALGNDYQFDVRDSYEVVNKNESGETAIVDVYYSKAVNHGVEKHNIGIVSYNKELLVYTALEFDSEKVTKDQIVEISKSLKIVPR